MPELLQRAAVADAVMRLTAPQGMRITDAQAKPWRRVLSSVLSPEVVMSLQLPLMVQDVTTQMRAIASAGEEVRTVPCMHSSA